jgi:hypothetical protein
MDGWQYSPLTDQAPRQKRHGIFQFSLRSLLVVMALVAAFFGGRATMVPRIEAERAKRLQAEKIANVDSQKLAALRQAAGQRQAAVRVIRFNSDGRPFIRVERPGDGIERAERVNLWQHQQRYQRLDLDVVPEPLPRGGPAGELPMRVR